MRARRASVAAVVCACVTLAGGDGAAQTPDAGELLIRFCDRLLATQITDPADPDFGALRCPSNNPEPHPTHSRAAEMVYPLAVAFERTGNEAYRRAAIPLGDWLVSIQQPTGAWGESWPGHDGWTGTTVQQLISLASAYPVFGDALTPGQRAAWLAAITRAAGFVHERWPMGNINYWPAGAVALRLAAAVIADAPGSWLEQADALIAATLDSVNADNLIVGEGGGVDIGYNLSQSIGLLALYGRLTDDRALVDRAAEILEAHLPLVYPNGSIDNSWGTRSYKWTYESGTKTAPGVYFSLALLADRDARFAAAEQRARDYLVRHSLADGWVTQGPHAIRRASAYPPCNYGTFARAQSLALALAHASPAVERDARSSPAEPGAGAVPWFDYYPTVNVTVVRAANLVATVSAYGEVSKLPRELITRGGSVTNLWFDGFGAEGFLQTSSVTNYRRQEAKHMPDEGPLQPLTPRIEVRDGSRVLTNLYEDRATMTATGEADHVKVEVSGLVRDREGRDGGIHYTIVHRFHASAVRKEFRITSDRPVVARVIEPIVKAAGLTVEQGGPDRLTLRPGDDHATWTFAVTAASAPFALTHGRDEEQYWCPFPAVEACPVEVTMNLEAPGALELQIELSRD